jgi:hypothetical protein
VVYQARTDWLDPVTAYAIEGTRTVGGAYLHTVTVSFTATDDASGVDQTLISFDGGGSWTNYEAAITFDTPGSHSLAYYSVDLEGNQEQMKTLYLSVTNQIDQTGFDAWALQIADETKRGEGDCPMDDGIANLAKYAVGLNPAQAHTSADLFSSRVEAGYLILRYRKSKQATDALIIPKSSTSLTSPHWGTSGIQQNKLDAEETDIYEVWEARLPTTASTAYMRLSFSLGTGQNILTFAEWAESVEDTGLRSESDCPMGDGIPNLAKYAVGLAATNAHTSADLFVSRVEGDYLILRYKKSVLTTNVFIIPEWSTSLTSPLWSRTGIEQHELEAEQTDEHEVWEARLPLTETKAYMRLSFSTDSGHAVMTFATWAESIPEPGLRGASDCPMGDGIPNLMKYAAGLDPTTAYATADLFSSSLETDDGEPKLVMLYYKDPSAVNVHLYPVTAPALTDEWVSDGVENLFTGQLDENNREVWKAAVPIDGASRFLRLTAEADFPE